MAKGKEYSRTMQPLSNLQSICVREWPKRVNPVRQRRNVAALRTDLSNNNINWRDVSEKIAGIPFNSHWTMLHNHRKVGGELFDFERNFDIALWQKPREVWIVLFCVL